MYVRGDHLVREYAQVLADEATPRPRDIGLAVMLVEATESELAKYQQTKEDGPGQYPAWLDLMEQAAKDQVRMVECLWVWPCGGGSATLNCGREAITPAATTPKPEKKADENSLDAARSISGLTVEAEASAEASAKRSDALIDLSKFHLRIDRPGGPPLALETQAMLRAGHPRLLAVLPGQTPGAPLALVVTAIREPTPSQAAGGRAD